MRQPRYDNTHRAPKSPRLHPKVEKQIEDLDVEPTEAVEFLIELLGKEIESRGQN